MNVRSVPSRTPWASMLLLFLLAGCSGVQVDTTDGERFKAGGYQTGFLGKWHLSASDEIRLPTDQGFEVNIAGGWKGHPHHGFFSPYNLAHLNNGPKGEYLPDRLTTEAIGLMDSFSRRDPPWFVFMSYYTVHSPFHSKPEKTKKYVAKAKASKVNLKNPAYAGMVESLDENVGRLLAWLDEKGLRENTIVVLFSDHGYHIGEKNRFAKHSLWERGTRVPLVIAGTDIAPAQEVTAPTQLLDIYPTLVDLAGPLLTVLAAQFVLAVAVNIFIVFPAMGRNYDAAVVCSGFGGISLGSTPTAMANMSAVTKRYGPSHLAFIVVPLVCAFFIDLVNAMLIPFFLANF